MSKFQEENPFNIEELLKHHDANWQSDDNSSKLIHILEDQLNGNRERDFL